MIRIKVVALTILMLSCWTPGWASRFAFLKYDVDNGLSNNTVRCVAQDSLGFMWFGTADGLSRFDGRHYRNYYRDADNPNALGNSAIYSLYVAPGGQLWIGTANGIYIYEPTPDTFRHFSLETENHVKIGSRVNSITGADDGRIWIGTQGQGLFIYDPSTESLRQSSRRTSMVSVVKRMSDGRMVVGSEVGSLSLFTPQGDFIRTLFSDIGFGDIRNAEISALCIRGDTLWFGMGIRGFSDLILGDKPRRHAPDKAAGTFNVQSILSLSERELLIGTNSGLYQFDIPDDRFTRAMDTATPFGDYHHSVNDIYRDREGGIWIATEYGGVHYLPRHLKTFEQYLSVNSPDTRGGMIVTCFCEDNARNIWVGTVDNGIFCFHAPTGRQIAQPKIPFIANVQCMMFDGPRLWVGTAADGLYIIDTRTGGVENCRHKRYDPTSINDNCVTALLRDHKGRIFVGTAWGLNRYERKTKQFAQESRANNQANVSQIIEDRLGNIWIATRNTGVFRYTPGQNVWRQYGYNASHPESLRSNHIETMFEDLGGRIWFGSENGLSYYSYETNAFARFDPEGFGSMSQMTAGIEQDREGRLWVSGNTGICCIDIAAMRVVNRFGRVDGLQSNQFNPRAVFKTRGGKLFFGGVNGFNAFNPDRFRNNDHRPEVRLTGIYVNSREVTAGAADSPLKQAVYETKRLKLRSFQNSVTFNYAAFSYQSPRKNRYRYRLTGWDADWVDAGYRPQASYSNLPPGRYRFEVEGSNNDGVWCERPATLDLTIVPPLYRTTVAYVFYVLLFFTALILFIVMQNRRHHRRLREYAAEQEKATYRAKIEFFTNLAHEIRTPLSLIKAPLESIVRSGDGNIQTRNYLEIMNRNVATLLNLINQLLDFRKMEEMHYSLQFASCDIVALVEDICIRFRAAVETSGLRLEAHLPDHPVVYNVDRDAMTKIINNVLVNAVKYASSQVRISLTEEGGRFRIVVTDDGPGIDRKMRSDIFKVFYRAGDHKTGTGLGLPLARLLAEKHGGTLQLLPPDAEGGGAAFEIRIPQNAVAEQPPEPLSETILPSAGQLPEAPAATGADKEEESVVLIVEDNEELRGIVSDIVSENYSVLTACTGRQALEVLAAESVDVIVSDLMMPEMDGYELCEFVKSDMRYCHIPVIQLTAKASVEDRIKGLEYGADAYIEKPFSPNHLLVQIRNILENRHRLRAAYGALPQMGNAHIAGTSHKDQEFMEKLNAEILANIGNENFYIESLAENMYMSRSNFYRKVKALLGVSPNEYLRTFRLEQAASLLRTGEYTVSDIYMYVGFSSISYFSSCFKRHFGMAPSKYIEEHAQQAKEMPAS